MKSSLRIIGTHGSSWECNGLRLAIELHPNQLALGGLCESEYGVQVWVPVSQPLLDERLHAAICFQVGRFRVVEGNGVQEVPARPHAGLAEIHVRIHNVAIGVGHDLQKLEGAGEGVYKV